MDPKAAAFALFALVLLVFQANAQPQVGLSPFVNVDQGEVGKAQPKQPDKDKKTPDKKLADPPTTDIFAQAPAMGNNFPTGFNPQMMGDFGAFFTRQIITVTGVQTTTTITQKISKEPNNGLPRIITTQATTTTPFTQTRTILIPGGSLGAFKVAENASPRPVDRVFFSYNYFGNLRDPSGGSTDSFSPTPPVVQNLRGGTITTSIDTFIPGSPRTTANLHREVFGFEKTFLDGFASIEVRLPLLQQNSNLAGFAANNFGDVTIIGKYAFYLDRTSGDVVSGGLAITAPTGPGLQTNEGTLRSTRFQPWGGYIWNFDRFFIQAFHSVVVPTDARDITLLFNDVGLNYWLYRGDGNRTLNFIVPMIEAHVTNPLNHRNQNGPIYIPDVVVMTGGVHLGLFRNSTLSLGVATPVSGPRVYNIEGFMQLNWRF